MGGRFGDGPVQPMEDEPVFVEDWHARALAVTLACGALGAWNIDTSRHARERLAPKDYARFSYYEKWMAALTDLLVEQGLITREELGGAPPTLKPLARQALMAAEVDAVLAKGGPADRPAQLPVLFEPGQAVVTRRRAENDEVPGGHTRLPAYAAGARGRILRFHGHHVLPDRAAHGQGDAPEPLYAVAFPASELWRAPEHPGDDVVLDLWQSYLGPV